MNQNYIDLHVSLTLYWATKMYSENLKIHEMWREKYIVWENLMSLFLGMIQRLEKLKKNAFASCCLFGADNASAISGEYFFTWKIAWNLTYSGNEGRRLDMKMSNYTGPQMFMKLWTFFFFFQWLGNFMEFNIISQLGCTNAPRLNL